ncbi:hypothetical protein ACRRTK_024733 [Alexandromys fortis]
MQREKPEEIRSGHGRRRIGRCGEKVTPITTEFLSLKRTRLGLDDFESLIKGDRERSFRRGAAGPEERHGAHLCHEDPEESRHAGERAGRNSKELKITKGRLREEKNDISTASISLKVQPWRSHRSSRPDAPRHPAGRRGQREAGRLCPRCQRPLDGGLALMGNTQTQPTCCCGFLVVPGTEGLGRPRSPPSTHLTAEGKGSWLEGPSRPEKGQNQGLRSSRSGLEAAAGLHAAAGEPSQGADVCGKPLGGQQKPPPREFGSGLLLSTVLPLPRPPSPFTLHGLGTPKTAARTSPLREPAPGNDFRGYAPSRFRCAAANPPGRSAGSAVVRVRATCGRLERAAATVHSRSSNAHPPAPGGRGAQWTRGHRGSAREGGGCGGGDLQPAGSSRSPPGEGTSAMPVAGSELKLQPAAQQQGTEAPRHGELQYLGPVEHIMRCGFKEENRTSTGTLSVFGMQAPCNRRGDRSQSPLPGGTAGGRAAGWARRRGAGGRECREIETWAQYVGGCFWGPPRPVSVSSTSTAIAGSGGRKKVCSRGESTRIAPAYGPHPEGSKMCIRPARCPRETNL